MSEEKKCGSPCVVVFDIDGTMCHHNNRSSEDAKIRDPECVFIPMCVNSYTFKPHLDVLLRYLLDQKCRIAFFSAGNDKRNEPLIKEILVHYFGVEKYVKLVKENQFKVFSSHHLRYEGRDVKNLLPVLMENETLDDIILIDDNPDYSARSQRPCIIVHDFNGQNNYSLDKPICPKMVHFAKNGAFYLLGLFKTFFETDKYTHMSLRESVKDIIPFSTLGQDYIEMMIPEYHFQLRHILEGLKEVRKTVPNAVFYGSVRDLDTYDPKAVPPVDALKDEDFRPPVSPAGGDMGLCNPVVSVEGGSGDGCGNSVVSTAAAPGVAMVGAVSEDGPKCPVVPHTADTNTVNPVTVFMNVAAATATTTAVVEQSSDYGIVIGDNNDVLLKTGKREVGESDSIGSTVST